MFVQERHKLSAQRKVPSEPFQQVARRPAEDPGAEKQAGASSPLTLPVHCPAQVVAVHIVIDTYHSAGSEGRLGVPRLHMDVKPTDVHPVQIPMLRPFLTTQVKGLTPEKHHWPNRLHQAMSPPLHEAAGKLQLNERSKLDVLVGRSEAQF